LETLQKQWTDKQSSQSDLENTKLEKLKKLEERLDLMQKILAASPEDDTVKNLENQQKLMQKILDIKRGMITVEDLEKQLSIEQRISVLNAEEIALEDLKKQLKLMQRIAMLRPGGPKLEDEQRRNFLMQQIALTRQMQNMQPKPQANPNDNGIVFTSLQVIKDFFGREKFNAKELMECIERTRQYYFNPNIQHPVKISQDVWRKAKIVEMFYVIKGYLDNQKIVNSVWTNVYSTNIQECTGSNDLFRDFEHMKLLLASQSAIWDESEGNYRLSAERDPLIVREAIKNLCRIAKEEDGNSDVVSRVKTFLDALKRNLKNFFPPDYDNSDD
jgi:hypothetical protein